MDVGNTFNIEAVLLQHGCDNTLPDIAAQLGDLKILSMHHRHHNGIDAHHISLFIKLHRDLGLAVRTQQVIACHALGQTVGKRSCQRHRQRHQLRRLGTGTAEHHTLVTGTAHLVIGAHSNIRRLGMYLTKDLHSVSAETGALVGITDFTDHLTGNALIVHHSLGGDLTADQAEVGGDSDLAGHTGVGVLGKAGVQDRIGNGIRHLVGVTAGDTLRCKQSLFHNVLSFLKDTKIPHTEGPDVRFYQILISRCRRIWHLV